MLHWLIFGLSIVSIILALVFGFAGTASPIAVPVSLAFNLLGLLGIFTAIALQKQNRRLEALEQRKK